MKAKNKRILSFLIGMNMLFSFAGCSNTSSSVPHFSGNKTSTTESMEDSTLTDDVSTTNQATTTTTTTKPTTTTATTSVTSDDSSNFDVKTVYTTTSLNLRKEPNTNSEIITVISPYDKLNVIDANGDWYYVSYNKTRGYVSSKYVESIGGTYVEIDISDQDLYLYIDDELSKKADVVTGKKGVYDTRLGCNAIYSKTRKTYLKGSDYKVFVDFWMPFDGGQGLHDASWRDDFSDDAYLSGSHGCVNMKHDDAKYVYDNVKVGTKVLVHK